MADQATHIETERKLIHLMLHYHESVDEMVRSGLPSQLFDGVHQQLVQSIYSEYLDSDYKRLLTREHYRSFFESEGKRGGIPLAMTVFDNCYVGVVAIRDDLGLLKKKLVDSYVARCLHESLEILRKETKSMGAARASSRMIDRMNSALTPLESKHFDFHLIEDLKDSYIAQFQHLCDNPDERIICGIPEIDEPISVGFRPGHLTLIAADVGGHKSNLMMNIALHLYEKYDQSILFVPLEMSSTDLLNRIISNRTGIPFEKIVRPSYRIPTTDGTPGKVVYSISPKETEMIKGATIWLEKRKFAILDVSERTSVNVIRSEIEKKLHFFRPKIVVLDYIALMSSGKKFGERHDLEIGEILKTLRFLGRKLGFHILSAVQIGRAALSKMRQDGFDKVQLDSTALAGSSQYANDADTVFALYRVPDEEDKLKIFTIKARHGRPGQTGELRLKPECFQILSTKDTSLLEEGSDIQSLAEELNQTPEEAVEELKQQEKKKSMDWGGILALDDLDIG